MTRALLAAAILLTGCATQPVVRRAPDQSVARQWNETLLGAIRLDFARPTIHARNLYHTSAAMWDAWAAYDDSATQLIHHERATAAAVKAAREEAISYAVYRVLRHRFRESPGAAASLRSFRVTMRDLGYDPGFDSTSGNAPAALGNRIAAAVIAFGLRDESNEQHAYANRVYESVNWPIEPVYPGNPYVRYPNRWQRVLLDVFVDQSGNAVRGGVPSFLSPEWGKVTPFALSRDDLTIHGGDYWLYHDPGPPPLLNEGANDAYRKGFVKVVEDSSWLDPEHGPGTQLIDISPASRGNNPIGTNAGHGRELNPVTGKPYVPNRVPAGDYYRVLAEFWADGPDSDTPPGHWFAIANYVSDETGAKRSIGGRGPAVDPLEWDVKLYLALGGAMHDAAVSAWGIKGWYDYTRPVSAIRYMAGKGQNSDPDLPRYDADGITLIPGLIELVTEETTRSGERHAHLLKRNEDNLGKIAIFAWRGPDYIVNPASDVAGVGWILAENWWPYQRPTFVTPPFAGYVSGHSTFSRAAAVVLSRFTGSEFFPGGMGTFAAPKDRFLEFEDGPSVDVLLQWATYYDAADETSISRIYGGIHPPQDDIPGRLIGARIGEDAYRHATRVFAGESR